MSKKTKRLEKENMTLTRKHDLTNRNIIEMAEERTRANRELQQLRKNEERYKAIITQMQQQGRGVPSGAAEMLDGTTDGEEEDGDPEGTESEYEYDEEVEGSEEGEYDEDTEEEIHQEPQPYGPVPPPPPAAGNAKGSAPVTNGVKQ